MAEVVGEKKITGVKGSQVWKDQHTRQIRKEVANSKSGDMSRDKKSISEQGAKVCACLRIKRKYMLYRSFQNIKFLKVRFGLIYGAMCTVSYLEYNTL